MPNHMMNSGSSAILGIGNRAETSGSRPARASEKMPIDRPTASPARVPRVQPRPMRRADSQRCFCKVPRSIISLNARTTEVGLGSALAEIQPRLEATCHSSSRTAKTSHGAQRRGRAS